MPDRRPTSILAILSAAVVGSILFASTRNKILISSSSSLRNSNNVALADKSHRQLTSINLDQFTDPKSIKKKQIIDERATAAIAITPTLERPREQFAPVDHASRKKCQIIYILGVEGATHHGFLPIIEALARNQKDPETNLPYEVDMSPAALKAGLFGWFYKRKIRRWGFQVTPEIDDPAFVQTVVRESCPDDGKKHVLIEWASFPSGQEDDPRTYRVHRQHEWLTMTPEEIANSDEALTHPTNMNAFYQAYSPYVDIKFVVLHRPFLETIASHRDWDGGPEVHSNIIRGFMMMLRRFLDTHLFDLVSGGRLWSLVCVESIMSKNYETKHDVKVARKHVMSYLTEFLKWPDGNCPQCFNGWRESTKKPEKVLGKKNVGIMREHMTSLQGVWPPPGEDGIREQQCEI